jgi:hypothetical protein
MYNPEKLSPSLFSKVSLDCTFLIAPLLFSKVSLDCTFLIALRYSLKFLGIVHLRITKGQSEMYNPEKLENNEGAIRNVQSRETRE